MDWPGRSHSLATKTSEPNSHRFLFVALDEMQSLQRKVDIWDKLLAHILDAAARITNVQINSNEQHSSHKSCKCTEVDGGIFQHLLWTVANLSFLCNKLVI